MTENLHKAIPLLFKALAFSAKKHTKQRRKDLDQSPYINHPIALANILSKRGIVDGNVLCAAILHDTIEDTQTTEKELVEEFGKKITSIVLEVTDDKNLEKSVRKQKQIEHAATISHEAKLVKLADKIANLTDILDSPPSDWSMERKNEYFQWAKAVVNNLRGTHSGLEKDFDSLVMAQEYISALNKAIKEDN
jgi:guanosine-3',5'-bis(diphosphate) 3'-pyrophosphohydrolase